MLPTTDFLGHKLTRLIMGDNPFNGWSYITDVVTREELLTYHTEERIIEAYFEAEKYGINGMLPLADPFILRTLRHYYERGGTMATIFQPDSAIDLQINMRQMQGIAPVKAHNLGAYLPGTMTDYRFETGKVDEIKEQLKFLRSTGMLVGLGSHRPELIAQAEEEGWDCDYYVCSLQNARRGRTGELSGFITGKTKEGLVFYKEDRPIMLDLISKLSKPCIAYKIFAGGQIFYGHDESEYPEVIKGVYREVFSKLKPCDIAAIGVWQGRKNQLEENTRLFNEVMSEGVGV